MDIYTQASDGVVLHRLKGRLDNESTGKAEGTILGSFADPAARVILDMRDVAYVSSAGLRVVLMAAKRARSSAGRFALFGLPSAVQEVFDISGFSKVLAIGAEEADARRLVGG
ncbi:STAS domain-containing protein [Roseomonas terrae]|jgi:anti-anti-sigma factor|uniref:Anti-sigma factor antagonist n=1 Tax=Neoroseomonas terrae TaxID=424799 RepID=A0ABS5EEI9_9PROT|nr:STAS domain-containing protein [Neoroseomonas terrae]MBR0649443.1 STAS domain-containing protein [Neoroseomonas terrae]